MTTLLDEVAEGISAWKCTSCEWFEEDEPESPLYECGRCGEKFDRDNSADGGSNRCPQCNIFAAKIADHACPDCQDEVEEVTAYACPSCDKLLTEEQAGEENCAECDAPFGEEGEEEEEEESEAQAGPETEPETPSPTGQAMKLAAHNKLRPKVESDNEPENWQANGYKRYEFFSKELLRWAAEDAILADRNRKMDLDFIDNLNGAYKYPVVMTLPWGDGDGMRVFIAVDADADHPAVLDIDWTTFWSLPKVYFKKTEEEVKA